MNCIHDIFNLLSLGDFFRFLYECKYWGSINPGRSVIPAGVQIWFYQVSVCTQTIHFNFILCVQPTTRLRHFRKIADFQQ